MPRKRFKLSTADIKPLAPGRGGCIASDRITVDGRPVGYMYRSRPDDPADSGWCFAASAGAARSARHSNTPIPAAHFPVIVSPSSLPE